MIDEHGLRCPAIAEHDMEYHLMGLPRGRLKATLVAGRILGTDEAFAMLSVGLTTIGHGYRIEKAISEMPEE